MSFDAEGGRFDREPLQKVYADAHETGDLDRMDQSTNRSAGAREES